jgi:Family of unknown function (DUF6519)
MQGDFSRDTFDRRRHFSRVLQQQGRVTLDADTNEQTSIVLHYLRSLAADLIGPHGGSAGGFEIICDNGLKCDFAIGQGHYYVDGILCENDSPSAVTYMKQPDFPLVADDAALLKHDTAYFVYLHVWERHVTYLQTDHIREVALGGPDTATRAKVVWQVEVAEEPEDCGKGGEEPTCAELLDAVTEDRHGCLRAQARMDTPSDDPCVIPPEARYRGPENQLYRVEIHDDGHCDGPATYKWSRDNGSVAFGIRTLQGATVTLDWLGPDARRSLKQGDWVEIVDDYSALRFNPWPLLRVESVDRVTSTVTLAVPEGAELPTFSEQSTTHPLLRRWDQESDALKVVEGKWIELEDGIEIYFDTGGVYRIGDYWLIPARTATGDVIWPSHPASGGGVEPDSLPPHGISHHYAPLARIELDDDGCVTCVDDCRCLIKPHCDEDLHAHGPGDTVVGQAAKPDPAVVSEVQVHDLKERIRGIGLARARVLWHAGYKTPEAVAAMTAKQLQQLLSIGESEASSILNSAQAAI